MSNEAKHTPEPWTMNGNTIEQDKPCDVLCIGVLYDEENSSGIMPIGRREGQANGERIVACVNACAGINPEAVPDMLEALRAALGMVDALLEEKRMLAAKIAGTTTIGNHRAMIRAAIVKAGKEPAHGQNH